jgi:spore maturation protein B
MPLVLVKMFSSSAANSLLLDIFKEFGPDSYIGRLASIIMSSTETIFYTMAVYFMAAGIKKSRYTLAGALTATISSVIASVFTVRLLF